MLPKTGENTKPLVISSEQKRFARASTSPFLFRPNCCCTRTQCFVFSLITSITLTKLSSFKLKKHHFLPFWEKGWRCGGTFFSSWRIHKTRGRQLRLWNISPQTTFWRPICASVPITQRGNQLRDWASKPRQEYPVRNQTTKTSIY